MSDNEQTKLFHYFNFALVILQISLTKRKSVLQCSSAAILMIQFFLEGRPKHIKTFFIDLIVKNLFERIMKMTDMFLRFALIFAPLVAGDGFASGLSNQKALKSLTHQDLNQVNANFDWLESPTIRFDPFLEFSFQSNWLIKIFDNSV